ncbi:MAG TPA: S9 family peptidase [Saprospiraceae bacterium]|nr:S9 family peptidase [Saprospiraceae bacterium]
MVQRITVYIFLCWVTALNLGSLTAQNNITLEDIYVKGTFQSRSVPGFRFLNDGRHYTRLEGNGIYVYDVESGAKVDTILEGRAIKGEAGFDGQLGSYSFSQDENLILLEQDEQSIYRHSSKSDVFVYDRSTQKVIRVFDKGKIANSLFSPDGKNLAFVFENNLYVKSLAANKLTQVSFDGKWNHIINGMCDWVYEEEFSFTRAFEWSPDGKKLAFLRFDETKVPEFIMPIYEDGSHPRYETFKYPKVGDVNSSVSLKIYDLQKNKTREAKLGAITDSYLPRIGWTPDNQHVTVMKLNRHQNHLQLLAVNANSGESHLMLEEINKYYVDIHDNLQFLEDGKKFLWTSEKNGYNSIYIYSADGKELTQLTPSTYDVLKVYGMDAKNGWIYFKAAINSPIDQQVYKVPVIGGEVVSITPLKGENEVRFSPTFEYYTWIHSTINTPPVYELYKQGGIKLKTLQENENVRKKMAEYNVQPVTFFTFTTSENVQLNGYQILPAGFDPNKKYPVIITQYSGPGSQSVTDSWKGSSFWWYQLFAQKGYMVVCVDPRGTGARGEEFKKMTYLQLGKYETMDMIETAQYLGSLSHVDAERIGIYGWSYGGYMSLLSLLKGNEVFKAAVSVAPVTNWKWYDSVYTERYMRTVTENESGYKDNSPVYFADRLKGHLFLAHGTADDNVHFQNTMEMQNALISANKEFESMIYPNRNHGIYGNNATIHLFTKMTNFFLTKL